MIFQKFIVINFTFLFLFWMVCDIINQVEKVDRF